MIQPLFQNRKEERKPQNLRGAGARGTEIVREAHIMVAERISLKEKRIKGGFRAFSN